jgi:3-oxoacyl-[acyl-carrier protein] reductase
MTTERPLAGTVAIVTGASRGLGRSCAVDLAVCGADLTLVARAEDGLRETAALVAAHGARCEIVVGDVRDDDLASQTVARTVERLGPVDLLVNNAGVGVPAGVAGGDIEGWWEVLTVNLRAPVRWTMAVLPAMVERGRGRIINVSSPAGHHSPVPFYSSYSASKAALSQFTASVAGEVAAQGIVVLAYGPGALTDMTVGTWENDVLPPAMRDMFRAAFTADPESMLRRSMALFRVLATGEADHRSGTYLGMGEPVYDDPSQVACLPPSGAGANLPRR